MRLGSGVSLGAVRPGRGAFEWSVMFSAIALLFPIAAVAALGFAARARRLGASRWGVAVACALWCALLGALFRLRLGLEILP